ncbi:hypothetical protein KI387_001746 [Taxus chinensis]|uniref:Pyridoxamine kinase/Phosphomethylpyrimidine kinase domain-containing protein n=1 Tax=Taxus chinensis TaxID=29808 RepID=A0AA38GWS3_TAXCH|nr:hypothetical protein KI387_001746 [Taxus chinensis]
MDEVLSSVAESIFGMTMHGSHSRARAGIQADMKACGALGGYCSTIITAVTAQNTVGVQMLDFTHDRDVNEESEQEEKSEIDGIQGVEENSNISHAYKVIVSQDMGESAGNSALEDLEEPNGEIHQATVEECILQIVDVKERNNVGGPKDGKVLG